MLCPAVSGLSRVMEVGDLPPAEGREYTPADAALTQERAMARVQLCLDLHVALVVRCCLVACSVVAGCGWWRLLLLGPLTSPLRSARVLKFAVPFPPSPQVIPLLDDWDPEIRGGSLRIVNAVLGAACDVSVATGLSACPRLSDSDDRAVDGVVHAALAKLRRAKDEPTEYALRWVHTLMCVRID
jgi:hypothetical protein